MSWDVYVSGWQDVGNITYNLSPMLYQALGMNFRELDGVKCVDAIPVLDSAIQNMERDPDKYEELNPKNGWGSYEGALNFLKLLRENCEDNDGYVKVT